VVSKKQKERNEARRFLPEVLPGSPNEAIMQRVRNYSYSKHKKNYRNLFIDWGAFERAAQRFMPLKDIAPLLGVHRETLNRHCLRLYKLTSREVWEYFASTGKRVLTSKLFQLAQDGDGAALRYLGDRFLFKDPKLSQEDFEGTASESGGSLKIEYSPTVKGIDLTPDSIKKMMGEFLDLDPTHPLKRETDAPATE
jgi:hypothetical protein